MFRSPKTGGKDNFLWWSYLYACMCLCVCLCVCARARACVRVCVERGVGGGGGGGRSSAKSVNQFYQKFPYNVYLSALVSMV